ncbi:hypothetical protein AAG570_011169 [Ranatra chinensis]|uniref:Beta-galactosidase n=1 Tax=Ranatra chinensis TaxID=642074 RepID=A0ABD0YJZ3_9HEMI
MDGKTFRYASGEMHYFRVPRQYWRDRLHKMKAAGLNAVSTFTDDWDLVNFIKLAEDEGLYVILRPGPYICAERDFGGYPAWLLTVNPNMKLRTSDPSHTFFIERWFKQLMPRLQPLLYGNGGPVIMVQVENEYGSYPLNDPTYLVWLRDLYRSYVGNAAVLFTTDGPGATYIKRGQIPGVLATIDFGPSKTSVNSTFAALRQIQPKGPLVNSEFYAGWLSYWGEDFSTAGIAPVKHTLQDMLHNNVSFNFYMFHGGTNFGFTSGSGSSSVFQPVITSYDYDAPITEAGDLTDKYIAIREVLSSHYPAETIDIKNLTSPKGNYGTVRMSGVVSLMGSPVGMEPVLSEGPVSFEALGQRYGFVAYHTKVVNPPRDPSVLQVNVRDRAIVFLDNKEVSVLQYTVINETPLPPTLTTGQTLTLLVENLGRRNYKMLSDCTKGLISNATIDGVVLKDWTVVGYPLNSADIVRVEDMGTTEGVKLPAFFTGQFKLDKDVEPLDTFLDMSCWGKGVVFINGYNLGRYWHLGPQVTLYVPGVYLRPYPMTNKITLMELHYTHPNMTVTFTEKPFLNKTINNFCSM